MEGTIFELIQDSFEDQAVHDVLLINYHEARKDFSYIGLWYARDKSEETFITTEFYYADKINAKRPAKFNEELKENSFKQVKRFTIPSDQEKIWITTKAEDIGYCKMKVYPVQKESTYINYRIIRHRGSGFDTLGSGVIKGGEAYFFKLGIEDNTGEVDYEDTIMYAVFIKDLPPPDWNFDPSLYGIQRLPVRVPVFSFVVDRKYSEWMGFDPKKEM